MSDKPVGVSETRQDVLALKPLVASENLFWSIAGRQQRQQMFNCKPMAADDRFAAKDVGVECNSLEELVFVHRSPIITRGKLVEIGAESIGEPGTQLTMRTFHAGGTASRVSEQSKHEATNPGSGTAGFRG